MRPVIGVIASYNPETRVLLVRENYLSMLRAEGGNPVLLPLGASGDALEAQLDMCSGVLLTGGDDVEPARYGEETLPCCGSMTLPRDAYEIELIRRAVERDIPMLGICRGIQVLNVALGGSLYVRGVQWHPEYMVEPQVRAEVSAPQRAMIREFIEAAAEYARRQGGK